MIAYIEVRVFALPYDVLFDIIYATISSYGLERLKLIATVTILFKTLRHTKSFM